ncbi:hypothetical protein SRHO_G00091070 [Serrasalmus rhombeus]
MLRVWVLSVAALLNGLSAQETDYGFLLDATATEMITPTTVSILPTTGIIADSFESLYRINMNHNMQVCSTWGNFHFSTFDGQLFQLPYACNYILTTLCDSTKTDFNIQMRRQYINNLPTIRSFTIKIDGVVIKLLDGNITMNDQAVTIPSYQYGVRIEKTTSYVKISSSKLEVEILWDQHNFLSVEIPTKYRNQTCGLCGDFNGVKDNEFIENGKECPFNLEHRECGSPCKDTCSNQEGSLVCNEHCSDGCFCPADQVTVFKPSTFYIIARSPGLLLVIQMVPVMQVYIMASSIKKGTLSGLCGNFNDVQADDFKTKLGLTEGTGATFANTWKAMSNCPDISISQENPCSMSVEKEKYAREWCNMLTDPKGVFSPCHAEVNPKDYKDRCIYDTCNCAKSEECMCAAVSSYVYACAAKRVRLHGWRNATCGRFSTDCPGNMEYYYSLSGCGTTCRSLSGYDHTCQVIHTPVDGCGCAKGTYLSDKGECVPASSCPCYYNNQVVAPSQVISKDGTTCSCTLGKLHCIGQQQVPTCKAPMYFFNCSNAGPEARGTECQKSCQMLDSDQCVSTECMSGCVCPSGLLADGQGGCVKENDCPCVHNGVFYQPGQTVKEDCNTCTCRNGTWSCTHEDCPGTCTIYGDGHYITFDGRRYSFSGDCEYTLVQDYCSNTLNGSFRVITENIPCGTTGTTCSKSIKIFLGNKELLLSEENIKVLIYDNSTEIPYKSYTVGIYFVIEASHGLVLFWDKKTSLMIKLEPSFKGTVCGLCGNYDGNGKNDFVTRGGEEVVEPLELGNSWRVSPTCPKASSFSSPCDMRPHRQTWAVKHCSIIKSDVFSACHSLVDPAQYYDICVQDTCACDSGGDCECFCTAVAAYAAVCNKKGACISWRTPTICRESQ